MHLSTKTYGHEIGLSACFRQHRAHSHCNQLHGYALSFKFTFAAAVLDERNWVVDFGGLKGLKGILENTFDHKCLVARDDPQIDWFIEAGQRGILDPVILDHVGCEKFAEYVYEVAEQWLIDAGFSPRCSLVSVEVKEHGANGAIFTREGELV